MNTPDFTTTLLVDQSPKEAFNAITNVRGWWSENIEGGTARLNDVFEYRYEDVHYCKVKLIEVVPDKKVVWSVLDNHFNFTKDTSEWKGTKVIFEISQKDKKTQIRFTHQGLVPEYECFDVCREGWGNYINLSLRNLIVAGKGQPNPKEGRNEYQEDLSQRMNAQDYHTSITVNATAQEAFKCINSVTKWWTENLEGSSQKLNDEFTVRFDDVHVSTQKLVEVVPDKKVVWLVTESKINFVKDKREWTNTKVAFEISSHGDETTIDFTHFGLIPKLECYGDCTNAWGQYMQSLFSLITTGKGQPEKKKVKQSQK